jgi:hypothetical protein
MFIFVSSALMPTSLTLQLLSVCLLVSLSVSLSVCLSVCLSVFLSVFLSVCLSACLSVCQPVCLSVCLSACLSVCLSVPVCLFSQSVSQSPLSSFQRSPHLNSLPPRPALSPPPSQAPPFFSAQEQATYDCALCHYNPHTPRNQ